MTSAGVRLLAAIMASISLTGCRRDMILYRRQVKPFLKDLPRVARTAARYGATDVALMRHVRCESHPIAAGKRSA